ncbi:hypothetical protein, partial [Nonomuraea lactucae]|uniref:hypothetical protein n=1 Tax=Nonomuraea lactucae TaxID=2249762 RepID=UPI0019630A98
MDDGIVGSARPHPARIVRDRLTGGLYAQMGVLGFALYGFAPSISLLGHDHRLPAAVAALHSTAMAAGALAAGLATVPAVRRWGRSRVRS